jgi:hypothetical protein
VVPEHLLDPRRFDFLGLGARGAPRADWLGSEPAEAGDDVLVATVSVEDLKLTLRKTANSSIE